MALKPFIPQLQTTFIKCLQDNTRLAHSIVIIFCRDVILQIKRWMIFVQHITFFIIEVVTLPFKSCPCDFKFRTVRSSAALALGKLSALSTRVDPLVGDLLSGLQVLITFHFASLIEVSI